MLAGFSMGGTVAAWTALQVGQAGRCWNSLLDGTHFGIASGILM